MSTRSHHSRKKIFDSEQEIIDIINEDYVANGYSNNLMSCPYQASSGGLCLRVPTQQDRA